MQNILSHTYVAAMNRYREIRDTDRERGLTTTEIAVLTFVLVAMAAAIGFALYTYANDRIGELPADPASAIPDPN